MTRKEKRIKTIVTISNMISTLKREFVNKDLLDEMISGLNLANHQGASVKIVNNSELIISVNHNSQVFGIKFEPSLECFNLITFTKSIYDGHEESVTTIDYRDGNHIIVTNSKLSKLRNNDNVILDMNTSRTIDIYQYYTLRYSQKYETKVSMNSFGYMGSSLEETYINDNNQAIKKVAKVGNDGVASLNYFENINYYPLPFDTRTNSFEESIGEYIPITEEKFETSLESFKELKGDVRK